MTRHSNPDTLEAAPRGALISYRQLAAWLGVPHPTLRTWVRRRRIPHVRLGARCVRFDPAMVQAWLATSSDKGGAP